MNGARLAARVLVCGNADRRDDGAAIWAAASIAHELRDDGRIEVRRCGQLDIEDVLQAGDLPLVVIDAAVGIPPGTAVTVSFDDLIDRPAGPTPHSSHALPINQVLGIARQIADGPIDGVFVGIGGSDFEFGERLSPEVQAGLPGFIDAIRAALRRVVAVPMGR